MTRTLYRSTLRHLRGLTAAVPPDAELVKRFALDRDEDAFAEILRRHGAMVFATCRSVLHCEQDAEDAFQATFLLLARKADTIRQPEAIAGWLHGVARRLSLRRRDSIRVRQRYESAVSPPEPSTDDMTWRELRRVLHEEIERLPDVLRIALVVCYLEGLTQDEAAARLGCPVGTLKSRLDQGRKLLRTRLARRGLGPMAVLSASVLPSLLGAAVSPSLTIHTLRAALTPAAGSAAVEELVRDGLRLLAPGREVMIAWLFAVVLCCVSYAVLTLGASPAADPPAAPKPEKPRTDLHGDALPEGAVARLGTLRLRHETRVGNVALSPDGKKLARSGKDGTIRVWDTSTGKELHRLAGGHELDCARAIFSPDSKHLASCGAFGEVRIWDMATGKLVFVPENAQPIGKPRDPKRITLHGMAYSADGKLLAGMATARGISVWDAATGKEVGLLPMTVVGRVERMRFLTDGRLAGLTRGNDSAVTLGIWDTKTHKQETELLLTPPIQPAVRPEGGRPVREIPRGSESRTFDVSPDGTKVIGVGNGPPYKVQERWVWTGAATIWDVASGKQTAHWKLPQSPRGVVFSSDGKTIACSQQECVQILDAETGEELRRVQGWHSPGNHRTSAGQVAFSADGKTLATDIGQALWVIDVSTGKRRPLPGGHEGGVDALIYSPDGKTIASASSEDDSVRLWNAATGEELRKFDGERTGFHSVLYSPDGKLVLAGGRTDTVRRWNLDTGKRLEDLPGKAGADKLAPDRVYYLATTADGKRLITVAPTDPKADNNPEAIVHELPAYREIARWEIQREGRLAPAPEGVLEYDSKRVILRDPDTGKTRWTFEPRLPPNEGMAGPCVLSPDGHLLATGYGVVHNRWSLDKPRLRIWEIASRTPCFEVQIKLGGVSCTAFSPDGRLFTAAIDDQGAASAGHGVPRSRFREVFQDNDPRTPIPFVLVWDLAQLREPTRFDPESFVGTLAFSPDSKRLTSGLMNTTALVWDVAGLGRIAAPDLEQAWVDLAGDASKAQPAVRRLARPPAEAIPFLAARVQPAATVDAEKVCAALVRLDSARFAARQSALAELKTYGDRITPLVREALKAPKLSREKRLALEELLGVIEDGTLVPERLRIVRAIQILELAGGAEARKVLERLAQGSEHARETREARASLARKR